MSLKDPVHKEINPCNIFLWNQDKREQGILVNIANELTKAY